MTENERFLITLASGIELFRSPSAATAEKRAALRSLVELSAHSMFKFHMAGDGVRVQGKAITPDLPGVGLLVECCRILRIAEVRISREASEADVLLLLQSMAGPPERWVPLPEGGTVHVVDVDSVLAPADAGEGIPGPAPRPSSENATTVSAALDRLDRDPFPSDFAHLLGTIELGIARELDLNRESEAVVLLRRLMTVEQDAVDGGPRRAYAITFRRLFTRVNLPRIGAAVDDPRCTVAAGEVLIRAGIAGAEVLVRRLERSRDVQESTRYVQVLSEMPEVALLLVPLLGMEEWLPACGAAELLGEFQYVKAVEALGNALDHQDARVRRAAVAALTRIGTHDAVAHVQQALGSEDVGMRLAVVQNVDGRRSGGLAMPLLKVADAERARPEVVRDCYLALGRIGTPVALQALLEATRPGGRIFGKKPVEDRLAALDGLSLIQLPAARQRLVELMSDRDPMIREAASAVLHDAGPSE